MKKTLVLGASPNPDRYAHRAVLQLLNAGHEVAPVGIRKGTIRDLQILTERPHIEDIHTLTLYVGPQRQEEWLTYILKIRPERFIFNPGTENMKLKEILDSEGIENEYSCTLVLLSMGIY